MPLTDIVAKMNLANKENKAEARDGLTPDKEITADAPLKVNYFPYYCDLLLSLRFYLIISLGRQGHGDVGRQGEGDGRGGAAAEGKPPQIRHPPHPVSFINVNKM